MITEALWWIVAAGVVGASAGVVFSRSVVHAAIFLILSLAGVGAIYLFLTVEFIALVQFLIYGGAVTVLILLALMLTRMGASGRPQLTGPQAPFGALVAAALMATLIAVAVSTAWPGDLGGSPVAVSIERIGEALFQHYGAPFIVMAALLLVAFVGAIAIARQEDGD